MSQDEWHPRLETAPIVRSLVNYAPTLHFIKRSLSSFLTASFIQLPSAPVMWTKTTLMVTLYLKNLHKIMATVLPHSLKVVSFLSLFSFFMQVKCKSYSFLWRLLLLWWIWVSIIRVWFALNFTIIISLKNTLFKPVIIWKTHQWLFC